MNPTQVVMEGRLRPDGTLVLADKVPLPPGPVRVTVELATAEKPEGGRRLTLAERFKDVLGTVTDLPSDMAANHNHYLYGTPKK
jgi:hypothetical protein